MRRTALAQHLVASMRTSAQEASVRLSDSITQRYCASCSAMLLPGINCSIRLAKRRSRSATPPADRAEPVASAVGQPPAPVAGAGAGASDAGAGTQSRSRVSARAWFDGQMYSSTKGKPRNALVCRCSTCGAAVAWRGSDTQATADRKMKRTQQRRSERFRDAEKAAATQRVDKMKAFVHEHNLAESAPTSGDKRRMLLPDTLSAKEQAALGQFRAKAKKGAGGAGGADGRVLGTERAQTSHAKARPAAPGKQGGSSLYDMMQNILGGQ